MVKRESLLGTVGPTVSITSFKSEVEWTKETP